jgi:hypothetical protein
VASAACQVPPTAELKFWRARPVHVLLIGSEGKAADLRTKHLLEWYSFCRNCGGSLTLLSTPGDLDRRDEQLAKQLRGWLRQVIQPVVTRELPEKAG